MAASSAQGLLSSDSEDEDAHDRRGRQPSAAGSELRQPKLPRRSGALASSAAIGMQSGSDSEEDGRAADSRGGVPRGVPRGMLAQQLPTERSPAVSHSNRGRHV